MFTLSARMELELDGLLVRTIRLCVAHGGGSSELEGREINGAAEWSVLCRLDGMTDGNLIGEIDVKGKIEMLDLPKLYGRRWLSKVQDVKNTAKGRNQIFVRSRTCK